jgi:WD40 repeat protein
MLNLAQGRQVELNSTGGKTVRALAWAANGEYLVSGDDRCVRMWRVGGEIAVMPAAKDDFNCLAVSNDGKWIAGGTWGRVFLWDAKTFKRVFDHWGTYGFQGVDFSPDSTALLVASYHTATVHDIASPARVRLSLLNHENRLRAAKYSRTGDRIATATEDSVRVWDSSNGHLLVQVKEGVTPEYNKGLFWVDQNRFFVASRLGMKLLRVDASICSKISEWHVPGAGIQNSCIALPRHGEFVACSANKSITFWDTSRSAQPGLIEHGESTYSIALSPDGESVAMGGCDGRMIIKGLSRINASIKSGSVRLSCINHFI